MHSMRTHTKETHWALLVHCPTPLIYIFSLGRMLSNVVVFSSVGLFEAMMMMILLFRRQWLGVVEGTWRSI